MQRMSRMLIKICGMKEFSNVSDVAGLNPAYMGFILFQGSPRYVSPYQVAGLTEAIPGSIKKVGVFVNEPLEEAVKIARSRVFDLLQLHGDENPEYCRRLSEYIPVIKAFRIADSMPDVEAYEASCEFFIFDTRGEGFGGNGTRFNHHLLPDYASGKKYLLAGGISPLDAEIFKTKRYPGMAGFDLNSRFETAPGRKDINLLKSFINTIRND